MFQVLPEDNILCQLLAWLFQSAEAKRPTSEFYQFRQLYPQTKFDIKKTKLRDYCHKNSKYLKYSRMTKKCEAFIQATEPCHSPSFREKLRQCYILSKKDEQLWSLEATITNHYIDMVKDMPFGCSASTNESLVREWDKRLSTTVKEELYNDETRRDALLSNFTNLYKMGKELKISTTQLAQVLLGSNAFTGKESITDPIKKIIFQQSREYCKQDELFGYLMDTEAVDSMKKNGNYGENLVKIDLCKLGITADAYLTEEQQQASVLQSTDESDSKIVATPDFLFHNPVRIFDKEIRWIEVKNYVIVPGISADVVIERLKRQVAKYEQHYGDGLVIFTRPEGFSDSLREHLPGCVLARRLLDAKTQARRLNQMKQEYRRSAYYNPYMGAINAPLMYPHRAVPKAKGHILGGEIDRETALSRYEGALRLQEQSLLDAQEIEELKILDKEIFEYINILFINPWTVMEDKLHTFVELISKCVLDGKGCKALKNMKTILVKALEHPLEDKYRRFNKAKVVADIIYATKFFLALGFCLLIENEVEYLVCTVMDEPKLRLGLQTLLDFESKQDNGKVTILIIL